MSDGADGGGARREAGQRRLRLVDTAAAAGLLLILAVGWPLVEGQWRAWQRERLVRTLQASHLARAERWSAAGRPGPARVALARAATPVAGDPALVRRQLAVQVRELAERPLAPEQPRQLDELEDTLSWATDERAGEDWARRTALAVLQAGRGQRAEAIAGLRALLEAGAVRSTRPLLLLGELLQQAGERAQAEAALRRAVAQSPEQEGPRLALAELLLVERARAGEAVTTLKPLSAPRPSARLLGLLGRAWVAQERYEEALEPLQQAWAADGSAAAVARQLGEALLRLDHPQRAVEVLSASQQLQPTADTLFALGRAQRVAGQLAEAQASLRRVIEQRPGELAARRELAGCLEESGQRDEALAAYRELEPLAARVDGGAEALAALRARISALEVALQPVAEVRP